MQGNGDYPNEHAGMADYPLITDPEGGTQDVCRFSMRQDASSKNPDHNSGGRFELDLNVFFGDFLDSRLRRSPFGPASPFAPPAAQCAKESYSRTSAKKAPGFTGKS